MPGVGCRGFLRRFTAKLFVIPKTAGLTSPAYYLPFNLENMGGVYAALKYLYKKLQARGA
jgi:hypothetical protein